MLVVAGSWGIGDVAETVAAIERCGAFHPIVVCGRDEHLRARLARTSGAATVLGWTDDMPGCMAAADVLVENAGGLSAMEAFAAEVPVVTYRPIAGHGKRQRGDDGRVGRHAVRTRRRRASRTLSWRRPRRDPTATRLIDAARALFGSDPTDDVADLAVSVRLAPGERRVQLPTARRRMVAAAAVGLVSVYAVLTLGTQGV